jgi:quercetin dioxygenase-like cupin family protein
VTRTRDGNAALVDGVVSGPDEGERLARSERELRVKLARPEASLFEFHVETGYEGPGAHLHREHVDAFYVLEGELEFTLDGETVRAGPGTLVAATPGVVHSFRNAGGTEARFLNLHTPGGFEAYLRALDELARRGEEPDRAFHERHDVFDV